MIAHLKYQKFYVKSNIFSDRIYSNQNNYLCTNVGNLLKVNVAHKNVMFKNICFDD